MLKSANKDNFLKEIAKERDLLIIQDIDGVCIPLVKDPMCRTIRQDYLECVFNLKDSFFVLTCGEHEGFRGVNRIVERALNNTEIAKERGLYLPGLAACGVEYQDRYGNISLPGITEAELLFLTKVPKKMEDLLVKEIPKVLPMLTEKEIHEQAKLAICDTRFSPTINLNSLFLITGNNVSLKIELQIMMENIMQEIIKLSNKSNLRGSFYLHKSPNLGANGDREIIKKAKPNDVGTTDIQLIINGSLKEAGLLVLINKYIESKKGFAPFGPGFNVKLAPKSMDELIAYCLDHINKSDMPLIVGVGDTVTSQIIKGEGKWLRGGSDRGFLTLIQQLGKAYNKDNRIIFVDSSDGEVDRPSLKNGNLEGISDKEDNLKFDLTLPGGHKEYINFIKALESLRN